MTPFQSGLITFADRDRRDGHEGRRHHGAAQVRLPQRAGRQRAASRPLSSPPAPLSRRRTPVWIMIVDPAGVGGFFRSLQFTSINTIAYAEVEPARVGRATALVSVSASRLSISAGVAIGALAVEITTVAWHGQRNIAGRRFSGRRSCSSRCCRRCRRCSSCGLPPTPARKWRTECRSRRVQRKPDQKRQRSTNLIQIVRSLTISTFEANPIN